MNTMIAPMSAHNTATANHTNTTNDASIDQRLLETALNPRRIQPLLHSFLNGKLPSSAASAKPGPACHILDAKYEPGKRCSILYEVGAQMIIGELTWPSKTDPNAEHAPRLPTMQLYPFEQDPDMAALPPLPAAGRPSASPRLSSPNSTT